MPDFLKHTHKHYLLICPPASCLFSLCDLRFHLKTASKVESRYVQDSSTDKNTGSVLEWWSAESELSIWPSARQLEKKFVNVGCRAVVLNETLYQRVVSTNVTSTAALTVQQVQRSRASSSSAASSSSSGQQQQVSASMASSQHSRDSYSFSAASKGTNRLRIIYPLVVSLLLCMCRFQLTK